MSLYLALSIASLLGGVGMTGWIYTAASNRRLRAENARLREMMPPYVT